MNQCIFCLLCLFFHNTAFSQDFRWEPGTVAAEIRGPDKVDIGLYLYITRDGPDNGHDWNMAKLDLPERWKIESVTVNPLAVILVTDAGTFTLTPENLGTLWRALIKRDRPPGDEALEKIWRKEGGFEPPKLQSSLTESKRQGWNP